MLLQEYDIANLAKGLLILLEIERFNCPFVFSGSYERDAIKIANNHDNDVQANYLTG